MKKFTHHHVHLAAHLSYLGMVSMGSSYYYIAAGVLAIAVVVEEFKPKHNDGGEK